MRRLIALLCAVGCAQQGFPPGAPERKLPPVLLSVSPDSGAVNVRQDAASFQYDEVLSEKPVSATDLAGLVLISPRDGAPRVGWHRSRISVRGRHDWKPNTTYTITLLPGLADLRGNVLKTGRTVVFSTGSAIAGGHLDGVLFDWVAGKPLADGAIEAVHHPDSTVYVARSDSGGRFSLPFLSPGTYTVRGFADPRKTFTLERRAAWDSAHVELADSGRVALYAFTHDTLPPAIESASAADSLTIRVRFDKGLDTAQRIDTSLFTLRRADSTVVPLRLVQRASAFDSARAAAARDTAHRPPAPPLPRPRGPADTTHRVPPPVMTRPVPVSEVVIVPDSALTAGATYRVTARDARGLLGRSGSSSRAFVAPKPAQPPKAAGAPARRDTTSHTPAAGRDTTHRRPSR